MEKKKAIVNSGVERNKKQLRNIVYEVEVVQLKPDADKTKYEQYRFKELGYIVLFWWYEGKDYTKCLHGFITPQYLKELIWEKQWAKFCNGKRQFIIQRRIDGKNIPKKKN